MDYEELDDYDLDELEQHEYPDQPGVIFYTCPHCGHEMLPTFLYKINGNVCCVDCCDDFEDEDYDLANKSRGYDLDED